MLASRQSSSRWCSWRWRPWLDRARARPPKRRRDACPPGLGVRRLGAAGRHAEELLAQFAGQPVTVDAVENRSLLGAISLFQSAGPALGDVVVLDLGYNDVADPAVFRSRIDSAMAALAGVKRVIWLNQHDWGPGRAGMNAELMAARVALPEPRGDRLERRGRRPSRRGLRRRDPPHAVGADRDGGARAPALRPTTSRP